MLQNNRPFKMYPKKALIMSVVFILFHCPLIHRVWILMAFYEWCEMEREKHAVAAGGSQLAQCIQFQPYIIHFLEYLYTQWNALTNEMHQMTLLAGEIIPVLLTAPQKVLSIPVWDSNEKPLCCLSPATLRENKKFNGLWW